MSLSAAELDAAMSEYLSQGGLITTLDNFGQVRGVYNEQHQPRQSRPADVVHLPEVQGPARNVVADLPRPQVANDEPDSEALEPADVLVADIPVEGEALAPQYTEEELRNELRAMRYLVRCTMDRLDRYFPRKAK